MQRNESYNLELGLVPMRILIGSMNSMDSLWFKFTILFSNSFELGAILNPFFQVRKKHKSKTLLWLRREFLVDTYTRLRFFFKVFFSWKIFIKIFVI